MGDAAELKAIIEQHVGAPQSLRIVGRPLASHLPPLHLLKLRSLYVAVEVLVGVTNVRLRAELTNPTDSECLGLLELPTPITGTTVSSAAVLLADGRCIDTAVVDNRRTSSVRTNQGLDRSAIEFGTGGYDPDVFRMPIDKIGPDETVTAELSYFVELPFRGDQGAYELTLPMKVPIGMVEAQNIGPGGLPDLRGLVSVAIRVEAGAPGPEWDCTSGHEFFIPPQGCPGDDVERGAFTVYLDPRRPFPARDVAFSYSCHTPEITGTVLVQPDEPALAGYPPGMQPQPEGGNFVMFLSPPPVPASAPDGLSAAQMGRRVVFLLDNSLSMTGQPLRLAKQALNNCLQMLSGNDSFAICIYNHRQRWWRPTQFSYDWELEVIQQRPNGEVILPDQADDLTPDIRPARATPGVIATAMRFVDSVVVEGLTDILTPVRQSYSVLSKSEVGGVQGGLMAAQQLPIIFLVTDGAVNGEHGIAKFTNDKNSELRAKAEAEADAVDLGCQAGGSRFFPTTSAARGAAAAGGVAANDGRQVLSPLAAMGHESAREMAKRRRPARRSRRQSMFTLHTVPRVFTFGIGKWVNSFFLRMLAQFGRGYFDHALRLDGLSDRIAALMQRASAPVLTDLQVGVPGATSIEVYPFPVPDLYCGSPVVVSGRYQGAPPTRVLVRGRNVEGDRRTLTIPTRPAGAIPVAKVFAKQQLDLLSATHWLLEAEARGEAQAGAPGQLRRQSRAADETLQAIVDLSVAESIPCAHTSMMVYPTTSQQYLDSWQTPAAASQRVGAEAAAGAGAAAGPPRAPPMAPPMAPPRREGNGAATLPATGQMNVPQPLLDTVPLDYEPGVEPGTTGGRPNLRPFPPGVLSGGRTRKKGAAEAAKKSGGVSVGAALGAGLAIGSVAATAAALSGALGDGPMEAMGEVLGGDCCGDCGDCGECDLDCLDCI